MHYAFTTGAAAALALLATQGVARAEPILYSETTTASGTLGGKSFENRPLAVYYLGDTTNISNPIPTFFQNTGGLAGFRLSDEGHEDDAGIFTGGMPVALIFKPSNGFAIGANSTNLNLNPPGQNGPGGRAAGIILGTSSPALASYTLQTAIGPVVGPGVIQSDPSAGSGGVAATFTTTAGDLLLTKVGNVKLKAKLLKEPSEVTGDVENDLQGN